MRVAVKAAYPETGEPDRKHLDSIIEHGLTPAVPTDYRRWRPLHWVIEAPDVVAERGGFDAIIGNPPFLGGKKLSPAMGSDVREWFVNVIAQGKTGHADLVAYFFLRAQALMAAGGQLGLIATNSIAQGDTREVALDRMVRDGFSITRAIKSRPWPAATANLEYAAVWGGFGGINPDIPRICDGNPAALITSLLEPSGRVEGQPRRLDENKGIGFIGCYVLGLGFVVEPEVAKVWIQEDRRNSKVLLPYLNGEDLNSRPDCSASRWVIDFGERSEPEARVFARPWDHVLHQVRPERIKKDATKYPRMVNEWWKFFNGRPAMRDAIRHLEEVLVIALVSKSVMPVRVRTDQVFSHMLGVFATDSYATQAVLSSAIHQIWAITYGSTLETRVRYTPSDVFDTFPRPGLSRELEQIGRDLEFDRRAIMDQRQLGLTKLYNLVNDPNVADTDVIRLREIHTAIDRSVLEAYGWADIEPDHGFHVYRSMERWTVGPGARLEIMDRLLEENLRRSAAESISAPAKGKRKKGSTDDEASLF